MDNDFVRKRITDLRIQKGVSYFQITPKDFVDTDVDDPVLINELLKQASSLKAEDLKALIVVAERLNARAKR